MNSVLGILNSVFGILYNVFGIWVGEFGILNSVLGILNSVLAFGLVLNLPWSRSLYPDIVAVKTLTNIRVGGGHNAENVQCSIINVQCSMFNC